MNEPDPIVRTPSNSLAQRGPSTHESETQPLGNPLQRFGLIESRSKEFVRSSFTGASREPLVFMCFPLPGKQRASTVTLAKKIAPNTSRPAISDGAMLYMAARVASLP